MRYRAGLRAWLRSWHEELRAAALATYRDPLGRVEGSPGGMARRTDAALPRLSAKPPKVPIELIERTGNDVKAHVEKGLRRVYNAAGEYQGRQVVPVEKRRVIGVSLRQASPRVAAQLPAFRERNVSLITSIPVQDLADVQSTLDEAWFNNVHSDDIAEILQERFGVSESRADLIARDQVLKLNAEITQARHRDLEIESYTWSTSGDERVRAGHRDLDGTTQRYDDPPDTGDGESNNPGEDYQCRCVAIPILPDLGEEPEE